MDSLPGKANVGGVVLMIVSEGKAPAHYQWKRILEKDWAGPFTIAKLTRYRYHMGLDPAFVCEQPQFKKGQLHWYEWIICENGGVIHLYDEAEKSFALLTTTQTAAKVQAGVREAKQALETDERLGKEIRFPAAVLEQVCELAGARIARRGRPLSPEQMASFAEGRKRGMEAMKSAGGPCL
ncbi:MAG: hypothetical protein WBV23_06280 [Desulfobaccales bacterium]